MFVISRDNKYNTFEEKTIYTHEFFVVRLYEIRMGPSGDFMRASKNIYGLRKTHADSMGRARNSRGVP
jgi:hypothetical protein